MVRSGNRHRPGRTGVRLPESSHEVSEQNRGKYSLEATSYQRLLALSERLETIDAVKEGLASWGRGEGRPMDQVFDSLEAELRAKA
jgi:hypothetical protein